MTSWLGTLFARISPKGADSRRLAAVVVGVVLLAWAHVAFSTGTVPEIPGSVLGLVALVVGLGAIKSPTP
jgi:hypothetical protein